MNPVKQLLDVWCLDGLLLTLTLALENESTRAL